MLTYSCSTMTMKMEKLAVLAKVALLQSANIWAGTEKHLPIV